VGCGLGMAGLVAASLLGPDERVVTVTFSCPTLCAPPPPRLVGRSICVAACLPACLRRRRTGMDHRLMHPGCVQDLTDGDEGVVRRAAASAAENAVAWREGGRTLVQASVLSWEDEAACEALNTEVHRLRSRWWQSQRHPLHQDAGSHAHERCSGPESHVAAVERCDRREEEEEEQLLGGDSQSRELLIDRGGAFDLVIAADVIYDAEGGGVPQAQALASCAAALLRPEPAASLPMRGSTAAETWHTWVDATTAAERPDGHHADEFVWPPAVATESHAQASDLARHATPTRPMVVVGFCRRNVPMAVLLDAFEAHGFEHFVPSAGHQACEHVPGEGYWEDIFHNRTAERTDFWESSLLCFTRAHTCGSWRDDLHLGGEG
jgi:hypothetical protein